jgi:hypothetical protein
VTLHVFRNVATKKRNTEKDLNLIITKFGISRRGYLATTTIFWGTGRLSRYSA